MQTIGVVVKISFWNTIFYQKIASSFEILQFRLDDIFSEITCGLNEPDRLFRLSCCGTFSLNSCSMSLRERDSTLIPLNDTLFRRLSVNHHLRPTEFLLPGDDTSVYAANGECFHGTWSKMAFSLS